MLKYFVRFVGHVIQRAGVELPHEIYEDTTADFEHEDADYDSQTGKMGLKQFVSMMTMHHVAHGMTVPKNPGRMEDGTKIRFDQRIVVPPHMLAYISVIVKPLTEQKPTLPELAIFDTGEKPKEMVM